MTSAYQQQLKTQLDAAEDELGKLRRERGGLIERTQLAEAGARERAALLEHARDLLEPWGGHGDAWPDIAPAIEELTRQLAASQKTSTRRRAQMLDAEAAVDAATVERDGAYRERAHLTAWLATIHPAVITPATDIDEPGWQILYITAGGRQFSWHIAPRDADLYGHVEHVAADDPRAQWDGHTTAEKYEAIRQLAFGELRGCPAPIECDHKARAEQAEARIAAAQAALGVPSTSPCAGCGRPDVVYRNYKGTPLCCTCANCCQPPEDRPEVHDSRIWEVDGEWNVSCRSCPAYVDNIGTEDDADEWAEEHKAAPEEWG
ncbi:hypothetical protein ACFXDE_01810 [Kitasatospora sp. NPDC059408]|uniref:hypothetical protein n=1 Tax=Kitasatospora sp. NPDC059408 TaxID=3346823 RepID=UPI00369BB103